MSNSAGSGNSTSSRDHAVAIVKVIGAVMVNIAAFLIITMVNNDDHDRKPTVIIIIATAFPSITIFWTGSASNSKRWYGRSPAVCHECLQAGTPMHATGFRV